MGVAALRHGRRVAALKGVDVGQVLVHGRDIAFAFVALVPLVVIVEDQRDHVVEADDEPVARRVVDAAMKALVERREISESRLRLLEQGEMVVPDARELGPCGLFVGERDEAKRRTQLEHRPDLAEFFGEVLGEALEDPAAALPALEETVPGEAIEIVPHGGRRHAELARRPAQAAPARSVKRSLSSPICPAAPAAPAGAARPIAVSASPSSAFTSTEEWPTTSVCRSATWPLPTASRSIRRRWSSSSRSEPTRCAAPIRAKATAFSSSAPVPSAPAACSSRSCTAARSPPWT